jgi:hypothetical protein
MAVHCHIKPSLQEGKKCISVFAPPQSKFEVDL